MARLSAAIMAHPARSHFVPQLHAKLDRDVPVVWDQHNDRWDTGRRSLLAVDDDATHHLVLQDDAVIPRDLISGVERMCAHIGDEAALCLYLGRVRADRLTIRRMVNRAKRTTSWIAMTQMHWGVGIVLPSRMIPGVIAWGDKRDDIPNYDKRISRWLAEQRIPVYYPWPSVVDHRNSPSLVAGRTGRKRSAYTFIGENASALNFDLSGHTIQEPRKRPDRHTH